MKSSQEQIYNPRNLFIYISTFILIMGAMFYLKYDIHLIVILLIGASFYWESAYLTTFDPCTHSDSLQSGTSALIVLTLFILKSLHVSSLYMFILLSLLVVISFEFFNAFIIKEHREEKSLWGSLILILTIGIVSFLTFKQQKIYIPELKFVLQADFKQYFFNPTLRGGIAFIFIISLLVTYRFQKIASLFSHGPRFYEISMPSYNIFHIILILVRSILLIIAMLLVGVHIGIVYYVIQISKTKLALYESYIVSLLYTLILTIVMDKTHIFISVIASIILSFVFFLYYINSQRTLKSY